MTFSEFAKMMYSLIGKGQKVSDYIIDLTNHIMEISDEKQDVLLSTDNEINPLCNLGISALTKIYNGGRKLSEAAAREIIGHLSKENFANYLVAFPNDVIDLIGSALQKSKISFPDGEVIDTCTDLFVSILMDCAMGENPQQEEFDFTKVKNIHYQISKSERQRWDSHYTFSQK